MKVLVLRKFTENKQELIEKIFTGHEVFFINYKTGSDLDYKIDVLIPENRIVSNKLIRLSKKIKLIQCGVGYDNVDIKFVNKASVFVSYSPGLNSKVVAEHTFALLMCLSRNICYINNQVKNGLWMNKNYGGVTLEGKVLGLMGVGHIGSKVAYLCKSIGMDIIAIRKNINKKHEYDFIKFVDIDSLLRMSDFLSIHLPLNDNTRYLMNKNTLRKMKQSSNLINTSRGAIINENDLSVAIMNGEINGAALDVFEDEPLSVDSPLLTLNKIILTPHVASYSEKSLQLRYNYFKQNVDRIECGEKPMNIVI